MENTKQTKLEKEVSEIINSNMNISKKLAALKAVDTAGRPGAIKAKKAIMDYKDRINEKLRALPCRRAALAVRHSRLDYYIDNLYMNTAPWQLASRSREVSDMERYTTFVDNQFMSKLHDVLFGGDEATDKHAKMTRRLKQVGCMLAPLMVRWRNEVKPMVTAYGKENADFMAKYGIKKYRTFDDYKAGVVTYTGLAEATKDKPCIIGDYCLQAYEDADRDWNYYSKVWHRAHGPKVTVYSRSIRITHKGEISHIVVKAFRQGVFAEALAEYLHIGEALVPASLRHLRTNKYFGIQKSVKRGGVQVYKQTFGKYVVGYVAEDGSGNTYHADSIDAVLSGLSAKVDKMRQEAAREAATAYTAKILHSRFGFCAAGMGEFCDAVGLDIDGTYTIAQLKEAVRTHDCDEVVRKYRRELATAKIIA